MLYPGLDNPKTIIHCISRHLTSKDFLDKVPDTVDRKRLHDNLFKVAALYNAELRKDPKELSEVTNLDLPEWLPVDQYRRGHFGQQMVSTIMTRKCMLPVVVDDIKSESAHQISKQIRQCIYGILLQHVQPVSEAIRDKAATCLHDEQTHPLTLKTKLEPLTLNKIPDLKIARRIKHL